MVRKNPFSNSAQVTYKKGERLPWQIDLYHGQSFDRRLRADFPSGLPGLLTWLEGHEPVASIRLSGPMPGKKSLRVTHG